MEYPKINIVDASNDINNFLDLIPQETRYMYDSNGKIFSKNELNPELLQILSENIIEANKVMLDKINHDYLMEDFEIWNICVVKNILFNLPCTLNKIIIIPISIIPKNSNNKDFIITLIHEKIHIQQRFNKNWKTLKTDIWVNSNFQNFQYDYLKSLIGSDKEIVYNPDTFDCNNTYLLTNKTSNQLFYAILVYKNGKIENQWFKISGKQLIPINDNIYLYEHPFEMFAYVISKKCYE